MQVHTEFVKLHYLFISVAVAVAVAKLTASSVLSRSQINITDSAIVDIFDILLKNY